MKWKNQITDLEAYKPGKTIDEVKKRFGLDSIVKLASNENPFGYSPKVDALLEQFDGSYTLYPDGYATYLREEVAAFLNVDEKQLIFTNGTDELIQIISRALLEEGKNTVMATPTFSQYRHNAVVDGAEVREIPLNNGDHDLEAMLAAIDEHTAVVWVCSPNNPTGTYIPKEPLEAFLNKVPKDVLVVLDEAYAEYVVAFDYYDSTALIRQYSNLIVTRTFSKIYGLASFRVGYGIANEAIIQALEPVRPPFNTNVLGQFVAKEAIKDQAFIKECREKNREGLKQFYAFCEKNGLHYYPSQTNFILIDFQCDSDEVFEYVMSRGYIIRSGKALGFPTSVRITVGTHDQNIGVIAAMEDFLQNKARS
ncbi:histidinol-phosphate transaminase [Heyndrickxia ginsengihumi]|uniref:histidinol-phosphate transaminase n=1 Tax=Heyndrickxia ginsengihumi TaxID=363870 RepID=UPI003D24CCC2